jgi:hypothetical protein
LMRGSVVISAPSFGFASVVTKLPHKDTADSEVWVNPRLYEPSSSDITNTRSAREVGAVSSSCSNMTLLVWGKGTRGEAKSENQCLLTQGPREHLELSADIFHRGQSCLQSATIHWHRPDRVQSANRVLPATSHPRDPLDSSHR